MQAMSAYITPDVGRYLPGQRARFGVFPGGEGSAPVFADTSPQQAGAGAGTIGANINLDGLMAEGRISAAMLAAVVVLLVVFHKATKSIQL